MKSFFTVGVLLLISVNSWAFPIKSGDKVKMMNDWIVPYSLQTADKTVYSTFCLEHDQFFSPGTTYLVQSVGNNAMNGGGGALTAPNGTKYDPVSNESKWLYAAYMSGVFHSVKDSALKVQNAIWYLEQENGGRQSDWNLLKTFSFDASGWDIEAVNITLNGVDNQSQLVGVKNPVPEPATMFLMGSGLIGLVGSVRRKKNKK